LKPGVKEVGREAGKRRCRVWGWYLFIEIHVGAKY
jgi:hypothetical protein